MAILPVGAQVDTVELPIAPPPDYYPSSTLWLGDDPFESHLDITKMSQMVVAVEAFEYSLEKGDSSRVVGLAGILDTFWFRSHSRLPDSTNMADRVPEYLCLYQPESGAMILKKKVCYTDRDPKFRI